MATKTFGAPVKRPQDFIDEIHKVAGETGFPLSVTVNGGRLVSAEYETTWKEGTTEPTEKTDKKTKETSIENVEKYTNKKLTKEQIKKLDDYLEKTISAEE